MIGKNNNATDRFPKNNLTTNTKIHFLSPDYCVISGRILYLSLRVFRAIGFE